jgi:ElaB/YqjD/DUF883 family membrane-anchored ribosome-binding protein
MPDDPRHSPAVKSMRNEQAEQRSKGAKGVLNEGLEDTFPASDPVSMTSTAISSGRTDTDAADRVRREPDPTGLDEESPLVDEALAATAERGGHRAGRQEIDALKAETGRLSDSAREIAEGTARAVRSSATSTLSDVKDMIRERPLAAVGIVAAIAFMWGATR